MISCHLATMNNTPTLTRSDIMEMEADLAAALRSLVPFATHSLYFPTAHNTPTEAQWISRERTLLLPLRRQGDELGVFMARGADARTARRLLPSLPALAALCLEHLASLKQGRLDELTGLARMPHLLARMEHDADMVRARFTGGGDTEEQAPLHKACMGLVVARCPSLQVWALEYGHGFADTVLRAMAEALRKDLPQEVLAARSGEHECTLLLPSATRSACANLASELWERLQELCLPHPVTKAPLRPHCVVGYALYPQDMESTRLAQPMPEQARHLLHKARLAAEVARQRDTLLPAALHAMAPAGGMAFSQVLARGGVVRKVLPLGRVSINLGRHVGVREGQRFAVWGIRAEQPELKGEVVLAEVRDTSSVADTLHLRDVAWPWEAGDTLTLAHEIHPPIKEQSPTTGEKNALLNHHDFLQRLSRESEGRAHFTLALVHLTPAPNPGQPHNTAQDMEQLLQLCRQAHSAPPTEPFKGQGQGDAYTGSPLLRGRHGETGFMFLHAAVHSPELRHLYTSVVEQADAMGLRVAVGLASYPYLQFRKSDIVDLCRKSLELALLLPPPQVGLMGSLALNISADQRYSRGDVFGAVEEYKLALLADADNAMAWNSLGVCMAALSRHSEARRYFQEALKRWKKNLPPHEGHSEYAATLYNLGNVCQTLGENRAASRYFRLCVQTDAEHYFAHLRLGQLAEAANRRHQARQHYTLAAQLEDQGKGSGGLARRHLARIALRQRKHAEARELLHESLLRNPQDAAALRMLAEICLDSGEDPSMAEMLARKSVGLRPEHAPSWQLLARCLRALGRESDACTAEDRAAAL